MRSTVISADASKVLLCYKKKGIGELVYELIDRKKEVFLAKITSKEMDEMLDFVRECKIADKEEQLVEARNMGEIYKAEIESKQKEIAQRNELLKNITDPEEKEFLSEKVAKLSDDIDWRTISINNIQNRIKALEEEINKLKTTF